MLGFEMLILNTNFFKHTQFNSFNTLSATKLNISRLIIIIIIIIIEVLPSYGQITLSHLLTSKTRYYLTIKYRNS